MRDSRKKSITQLCRELRQRETPSEKLLWKYLRNRQLDGVKFYRQKPLIYEESFNKKYFYIADFYSHEKNLVIELDGPIHEYQKDYDHERDLVIRGLCLHVLRIENEELLDLDNVLNQIRSYF